MSAELFRVGKEEAQCNVTLLACSAFMENICQNTLELKDCNNMGSSDCSSVDSSSVSTRSEGSKVTLNLKATELRLGLPGCPSPERDRDLCLLDSAGLDEKLLFPLHPMKDGDYLLAEKVSGCKRGFSDTLGASSEEKFFVNSNANVMLLPNPALKLGAKSSSSKENVGTPSAKIEAMSHSMTLERSPAVNEPSPRHSCAGKNSSNFPAAKAQVVGWPPVKKSMKNMLAPTSKAADEVDGKAGPGALFVKVSMDGVPYLRKVNLRTYSIYEELSSVLEKMFSCFTIGQCGSRGAPARDMLIGNKLKDFLTGSEYALTYEDKDGDWMLVGDVPWEMFISTCKRMRIMKSADAIGLGVRPENHCKP